MVKRLTKQQKQRLADPVTYAHADAASAQAAAVYGARVDALGKRLVAMLAGRRPKDLTGDEAAAFMSVKAEFDQLAWKQARLCEAILRDRLNGGGEGSELVDA